MKLATTASGNVLIDTHDGMMRRSRRERRIEAMRAKAEAERLADAQGLRLALEAALGMAAEIVEETTAPEVERAVEAAPSVATVDWRNVWPAIPPNWSAHARRWRIWSRW